MDCVLNKKWTFSIINWNIKSKKEWEEYLEAKASPVVYHVFSFVAKKTKIIPGSRVPPKAVKTKFGKQATSPKTSCQPNTGNFVKTTVNYKSVPLSLETLCDMLII